MTIAFLSHLDLNLYLFRLPVMKELIKHGHRVYAVCPKGRYFEKFSKYGVEPIAYKIERSSLNPFKEMKTVYDIYRVIKPLNLDILHTFTAKPNIYGTLAARAAKIPIIVNLVEGLGSFYAEDTKKNIFIRMMIEILYALIFRISDKVVFVNKDDPKYLETQRVISKEKIEIIKSVGIDTEMFHPKSVLDEEIKTLRDKLGLKDKIVVLMVARAIWHKGVREFYSASVELLDIDNVQFVLVGDIDEGNPSSVNREFLKSSSVMWLGHRDDVLALTSLCDIYVLPSYREGVPRTLLEAASMAKPIITTDAVGCREVVKDGYNGYLVPIKDIEVLSKKIRDLVFSEEKRKIMGENGRIRAVNEFDIKYVIKQYMALYKKLIIN